MQTHLPGPWAAAARLTGRLDLSPLVMADDWGELDSVRDLEHGGNALLDPRFRLELRAGRDTEVSVPWVRLSDPQYPERLRRLPFAPPVLFHRGSLELLRRPSVAIVGSRRCTAGGKRFAGELASSLTAAGVTVVSGLAYGIDAAAHRAAGARTVAVLGQGLDVPFSGDALRRARSLRDAGGTLLSEYLPGIPPSRWTFPQRNRVIAGLADATVVVEAAQRSGALITARLAADAGREVWVVPGSPWTPSSSGCLALLATGARPVTCVEDVLQSLELPAPPQAPPDPLLDILGPGLTLDELSSATGMDPQRLSLELTRRVLRGQVERLPGDRYARRSRPG